MATSDKCSSFTWLAPSAANGSSCKIKDKTWEKKKTASLRWVEKQPDTLKLKYEGRWNSNESADDWVFTENNMLKSYSTSLEMEKHSDDNLNYLLNFVLSK